jgi:hypothetical protein
MPLLPDLVRLIGLEPMHRIAILVGEHRHRLRAQFESGAHRSDRDLTTVGYENLSKHPVLSGFAYGET